MLLTLHPFMPPRKPPSSWQAPSVNKRRGCLCLSSAGSAAARTVSGAPLPSANYFTNNNQLTASIYSPDVEHLLHVKRVQISGFVSHMKSTVTPVFTLVVFPFTHIRTQLKRSCENMSIKYGLVYIHPSIHPCSRYVEVFSKETFL